MKTAAGLVLMLLAGAAWTVAVAVVAISAYILATQGIGWLR